MTTPAEDGRLSLNQMTVPRWTVGQAVDGCARAGSVFRVGSYACIVTSAGGGV